MFKIIDFYIKNKVLNSNKNLNITIGIKQTNK